MAGITTPIPNNTDIAEAIGGKAFNRTLLYDGTGADALGAVTAAPAANTVLGRMKAITDLLALTNSYVDGLEALLAGTLSVSAAALPLPTGAATDAKVEAVRALLAGTLTVALPNGAATAAKQDTTKASIDAQAPADDIFTIAGNDGADLATVPKALFVLTDGNLAVRGVSGTTVTIPVKAGMIIPLRARRVMTATTATVVGLV